MKKTVALMFIAMAAASAQASPSAKESVLAFGASIAWYGQDDLRIPIGGKIVWIDPVYGKSAVKADIILVTHSHPDHYSPARIKELSGPDTLVLAGFDGSPYQRIKPGDSRTEKGIRI